MNPFPFEYFEQFMARMRDEQEQPFEVSPEHVNCECNPDLSSIEKQLQLALMLDEALFMLKVLGGYDVRMN